MPLMIKKRHLHRRKVPERCFIVYSKSRFSDQARSVHFCAFCAFLCFFALVENPVDNCFSLWITLYHAVFNTTSLLVYSVRCPSVNRGGVPSWRGAVGARCCRAARRKKSFLRAFSDFFKKLFRVQNLCFRLFSPVLRTTTRACVFIIFEKNSPKNFSKNILTVVCTTAIIGTVNRTGAPPPDR